MSSEVAVTMSHNTVEETRKTLVSVFEMYSTLGRGVQWVIGWLSRLGDTQNPLQPKQRKMEIFVEQLEKGVIDFPYPSTIMSVKSIRDIDEFDTRYGIAAAHDQALNFAPVAVCPVLINSAVTVHVPTGLTSQFKFRHFVETGKARRELFRARQLVTRERKILWRFLQEQFRGNGSSSVAVCSLVSADSFNGRIETWPRIGH